MIDEWEDSDEQFLLMCMYFLEEKGDPTRYTEWNEARFKRLAPRTHLAWVERERAERNLLHAMETEHG